MNKPRKKNVVYTSTTEDYQTGETTSRKTISRQVKNSDQFVMLYIQHIGLVNKLPHSELKFLLCVAKHLEFGTNEFVLDVKTLADIMECSGLKKGTLQNCVSRLVKRNILKYIQNTWYQFNPEIFWYGYEISREQTLKLTYEWTINSEE